MDVIKYLERIGLHCDDIQAPSYDFLKRLQLAHLYSVPYENLDIISGIPISLDLNNLYDKIVVRQRGGFCFELNCLFDHFLKELGFHTKSYFARFWRDEPGIPIRRHRVIEVSLNEKAYICDVGIGAIAPRIPLLLSEGTVQEYFGESYRFECDANFGWVLYELRHGEWQKYFSFTTEMQTDDDFNAISYYCATHADSKFNKNAIVAIKSETGRKTIDGDQYKEFIGHELVHSEENLSLEREAYILKHTFGIVR
ncbi:MAG: arylamine N-acetyltransferase [Clostridia bacterium]|nr:arylamine N-acetyltransferase [Clostridia bacterium]